ncbi:glycosyltransferase [Buchananella hordeovulneris]|uniref:Uncharacterized protein n=1 Tax=Buchananella hordeovulneris TaxID=52770 RepID=A0A1Q5PXJ5_9ACTO|nr:glycosyltransferase [Buchananella hordeovulneris]OKL52343.1 hypothetical protein BSZ40_02350 [Buchananella hordeovulneris]
MPVLILAIGSRGDVQPFVPLARGLVEAGTAVRVVALDDYASLLTDTGAEFVPLGCDIATAAAATSPLLVRWAQRSPLAQVLALHKWSAYLSGPLARAVLAASQPGDTVVAGLLARDAATALVAGRGGRAVTMLFTGLAPSGDPAAALAAAPAWAPGWWRRARARTAWQLASGISRPLATELRRILGLAPVGWRQLVAAADAWPTLVAASPLLVPPAPDWPAGTTQIGFLRAPAAYVPSPDLAAFLAAGPPPVYIGLGSLGQTAPYLSQQLYAVLGAVAAQAGVRIVAPDVPNLVCPPDPRVFYCQPAPHEWLFARMAAVVHHGGAGTTMAGLAAGVPTGTMPVAFDQPYHGQRLAALGVGPAPLPLRDVTPAALTELVRDLVHSPAAVRYRGRAKQVAAAVAKEDAVSRAVALLADSPD